MSHFESMLEWQDPIRSAFGNYRIDEFLIDIGNCILRLSVIPENSVPSRNRSHIYYTIRMYVYYVYFM